MHGPPVAAPRGLPTRQGSLNAHFEGSVLLLISVPVVSYTLESAYVSFFVGWDLGNLSGMGYFWLWLLWWCFWGIFVLGG